LAWPIRPGKGMKEIFTILWVVGAWLIGTGTDLVGGRLIIACQNYIE